MTSADHKRWVQKSKREFVGVFDEPNHRQTGVSRAGAIPRFYSEPADPKKFHPLHGSMAGSGVRRENKGVVHPKDLRIPIGVHVRPVLVLRRTNHHEVVVPWVDCVPIATDVVCRVIHGHCFDRIHLIVGDPY